MPGDNQIKKTEITRLISKGRKQGFLLFEEVDKTFQEEMGSGDDFNEFLSSMDDYSIKILDRKRTARPKRRKSNIVSLEGLERTTDPVKLYLREMGNISLLTREGEIAIAREIERRVMFRALVGVPAVHQPQAAALAVVDDGAEVHLAVVGPTQGVNKEILILHAPTRAILDIVGRLVVGRGGRPFVLLP